MSRTVYTLLGVGGVVVAVVLTAYSFNLHQYLNAEFLRTFVAGYGVFAPLVFMALYIAAVVFVVPAAPLSLAGGILFGPWWGTVYIVGSAATGATCAFFIARVVRGGRAPLVTASTQSALARYDARIAGQGFVTVLFLRLVPLFPFSVLNYGLGLTSVRPRDFVLGTALGIVPGTFAYAYFGSALAMLAVAEIALAVLLLVGLVLLGKYLLQRYGHTAKK